jgi:hypothetical protein
VVVVNVERRSKQLRKKIDKVKIKPLAEMISGEFRGSKALGWKRGGLAKL